MHYIDIINYWYSERIQQHWFSSTPELDQEIKDKYALLWESSKMGKLNDWQSTAEGCVALIIVLDQFPLNMFRGKAKSFQTADKALEVTLYAIEHRFDAQLIKEQLIFLFMPLMHSEDIDKQELSVKLYTQYQLNKQIRFAKHHRDIIKRFGHFPHRNQSLGRHSTNAEKAYLLSDEAFKG